LPRVPPVESAAKKAKATEEVSIEAILEKTIFKPLVPFQDTVRPSKQPKEEWGPDNSLLNVYHRMQMSRIQRNFGPRNYWDFF
jgi:hypothetical protein